MLAIIQHTEDISFIDRNPQSFPEKTVFFIILSRNPNYKSKAANVPVNSKTAHAPLGQTPGHLTFLKNFGQIPRYVAGETVKCPTRLSFKEGQIPHPPGMLKQL